MRSWWRAVPTGGVWIVACEGPLGLLLEHGVEMFPDGSADCVLHEVFESEADAAVVAARLNAEDASAKR